MTLLLYFYRRIQLLMSKFKGKQREFSKAIARARYL